jgi:hypothetical protein
MPEIVLGTREFHVSLVRMGDDIAVAPALTLPCHADQRRQSFRVL